MSTQGVGIIGCGNISAAYLRLAPLFKGVEIRAVADLNMEAAEARATEVWQRILNESEGPAIDTDRLEALQAFVRKRTAEGGAPPES